MNMFRFVTIALLALITVTSCIAVNSTNVPGKKLEKIPKDLWGKYELEYPQSLTMGGETEKTYVTLSATEAIIENSEGTTVSKLGDSLFFSTIGRQQYISLGAGEMYNVFKLVKSGKDIELYTMSGNVSSAGDLSGYFTDVREIYDKADEDGESVVESYLVTIDDKKLSSYFDSDVPLGEPFILKKQE